MRILSKNRGNLGQLPKWVQLLILQAFFHGFEGDGGVSGELMAWRRS
jgi:hypothetical protein